METCTHSPISLPSLLDVICTSLIITFAPMSLFTSPSPAALFISLSHQLRSAFPWVMRTLLLSLLPSHRFNALTNVVALLCNPLATLCAHCLDYIIFNNICAWSTNLVPFIGIPPTSCLQPHIPILYCYLGCILCPQIPPWLPWWWCCSFPQQPPASHRAKLILGIMCLGNCIREIQCYFYIEAVWFWGG